MKRISKRFSQILVPKTRPVIRSSSSSSNASNNSSAPINNNNPNSNQILYGVSLSHLASLPIGPEQTFHEASKYVKDKTKPLKGGYRSYAQFLKSNPATEHLVRDQATVFVSYAWNGSFGRTMDALKEQFKDELDETFVWMDFAVLDQHKPDRNNKLDFKEWTRTFSEILRKIGKAVLVLTPVSDPIALSRSWCCFEWILLVQEKIPFTYCAPTDEQDLLILLIKQDSGAAYFGRIFQSVNVEQTEAGKEHDQRAIFEYFDQVNIVTANAVVRNILKEWLVQMVTRAEDSDEENPLQKSNTLSARALLHYALGELDDALPYFEKALELARTIPSNENNIAPSLNNLAELMRRKGKYENAIPLYKESLEMTKKVFGEDHPNVATTLNNLATLLRDTGDYAGAEPVYRESLAIFKEAFGADHPNVSTSMNNLASLLQLKGDYEGAESLYLDTLATRKRMFGDNHPNVANSLNNLGQLFLEKKDFDKSKKHLHEACDILAKAYGPNHPDLSLSLNNLASALHDKGDLNGAEKCYLQSLGIKQAVFGKDHPSVATLLNNLASLMCEKGDLDSAEQLYRDSLTILTKSFGIDHQLVGITLHNLAAMLENRGRVAEAVSLGRQAYDVCLKALGPEHPRTVEYLYWETHAA